MWRRNTRRLAQWMTGCSRAYTQFYGQSAAAYRARQRQQEEDFLRLLVMGQALGIADPAAFYCLELMPYLLEDYHAWHRRVGFERAPPDGFRCC